MKISRPRKHDPKTLVRGGGPAATVPRQEALAAAEKLKPGQEILIEGTLEELNTLYHGIPYRSALPFRVSINRKEGWVKFYKPLAA